MNKKHLYAFYGSLRPTMYNYGSGHGMTVIQDGVEIEGYELRPYGGGVYPIAYRVDDPTKKITVTLVEIIDPGVERSIHGMELGAGYKYEEVEINGENYGIYLQSPSAYSTHPPVAHGDWVKHVNQVENDKSYYR